MAVPKVASMVEHLADRSVGPMAVLMVICWVDLMDDLLVAKMDSEWAE